MLHLRLMLPADRTEGIVEFLQGHVGVAHLAVLRGAAVKPAGDLVLADVARESADEIVQALRERDVDEVGAISLWRSSPGSPLCCR